MLRTHNCGELSKKNVGDNVVLTGWVDTIREHGKLSFIDLRDRFGKTQVILKGSHSLKPEYCVLVKGQVKERKKGTENKELPTGQVEVSSEKVEILSECLPLPFSVGDSSVNEDVRMKWRYLDLRGVKMQRNLYLRHKVLKKIHEFLDEEKFVEIATPMLTKSSPEGARDFIVPSRIHPGKFYALPQSPQQYKQLLMVGGIDRYYQIAPCFRDEDARADRSPGEFYQLDLEMSFVEQEDILDVIERLFVKIVREIFPGKKLTFEKFPRLNYSEVVKKYGSDKPDLRKDKNDPDELAFAWIVDFPLFEEEMEKGHFAPKHHMFTMPKEEHWKYLNKKEAGKVKAYQHDFVLNGYEVGGGSIRIHKADIQSKIFELIGFDDEDKKYFEHMLTAFKYGVPPHGGIALGIERIVMVLIGEPNLREVMAFPKNKAAQDLLMDAPSNVKQEQLDEVHIKVDVKKKGKK
ncbi:aspartate--tRNA ligase [Candidatus Pacearchaeota archaeon]|nr:aspartate--tRNA ligase [Candidatus Pacearchaeota archaeon]